MEMGWDRGRQIVLKTAHGVSRFSGQASVPHELERQVAIDLTGDVALEDADDLALRSAFFQPSLDVGPGAWIVAHPHDHHCPESRVGLAVAPSVQPDPVHFARRGRDGSHPAEMGEGCLRTDPARVVPDGGEQCGRHVDADAEHLEERWCSRLDQVSEQTIEALFLLVQGEHPSTAVSYTHLRA